MLVVVVVVDDIETGNRSTNSTVGRDRIGERKDRGHCFYTQQEAATADDSKRFGDPTICSS